MLATRLSFLAFLLCSMMLADPSPDWPPIMGKLTDTKYANAEMGFEFSLPQTPCSPENEEQSIAFSTRFRRRLQLPLSCGDESVFFSASPYREDEETLKGDLDASVSGAMDGGGFTKKGKPEEVKVDGLPVMIQGLAREQQAAFYLGGVSHRKFWIDVMMVGPEEKRDQMRKALNELKFLPAPTK